MSQKFHLVKTLLKFILRGVLLVGLGVINVTFLTDFHEALKLGGVLKIEKNFNRTLSAANIHRLTPDHSRK